MYYYSINNIIKRFFFFLLCSDPTGAGMRSTRQATMGDTIIRAGASGPAPPPLAVIEPSKSMLFASVYPLGKIQSLS